MDELDKIKQLFNSGNEKLAFQLLEGIGYSKYDFIMEIYNEHFFKGPLTAYRSSDIGKYDIWFLEGVNHIGYHLCDSSHIKLYNTLTECIDEIIKRIENE